MKKQRNIFWGALLIVFGFLFLAHNYHWFNLDFSFREVAKFWPLMIVLAGVAVFFSEKRTIFNATSALLIAFAVPLAIYSTTSNVVDRVRDEVNDDLNFHWDDEDDDHNNYDDNDDDSYNDDGYTSDSNRTEQEFNVKLEPEITEAALDFSGGAAEFHLEDSPVNLFEAKTKLSGGAYKLSEQKIGSLHDIEFSMKSKKNKGDMDINLGNKGINNDVYLKLNKKPLWNIDLNIGAGDVKFDLSSYKVKNMDINTGAASIDLKLGDLVTESKVKVKSGVAKVEILVPKSAACQIVMDGALNAKDFDDFSKVSSGKWQTDNFDKAANKIYISVESGLSAVKVKRY
ncbi:hypothetical protein GVN16_17720 [Emticicia sp. CRIBPO]|uniref:LiaI-LiaF-like domain-containing protein n=1 Tax=Emticicia sp. CRIBPO TaxID=2683258 RepID=UPI0014134244|nr:DUF5668 domain-containing protein [Emticicia sp. CRIBPO]NBA87615.1 hypothetical protein [Emticicia sp. CRIBPO]